MIQKQNIGNAGEYYLAARLSSLDFIVTITLGRAERIDILALSPNGKLIKLSVKTTQNVNAKSFPLSAKDEKGFSNDFYYGFVKLNDFVKEPDIWIIPSEVVCTHLSKGHQHWLETPGRRGQKHKDTSMRQFNLKSTDFEKIHFPNWEETIDSYYMNFEQLIQSI